MPIIAQAESVGVTRKQIENWLRLWVGRLGLDNWEIRLVWPEHYDKYDDDPFVGDKADSNAFMWRSRDYEEARMYVNERTMKKWDDRKAEIIVIHELLHLSTRECESIFDRLDGLHLNRDVDRMLYDTHMHALEGVVDSLAHRLYELCRT